MLLVLVVCGHASLPAGEVLKPANERFAVETPEVPSLQRHVLPLLGRLGCNGRACHGSFQGQGGFRLSLFGYDFKADHDALVKGDPPQVELKPGEKPPAEKPAAAEGQKPRVDLQCPNDIGGQ